MWAEPYSALRRWWRESLLALGLAAGLFACGALAGYRPLWGGLLALGAGSIALAWRLPLGLIALTQVLLALGDLFNLPFTEGGFKLATLLLMLLAAVRGCQILVYREPGFTEWLSSGRHLVVLLLYVVTAFSVLYSADRGLSIAALQRFTYVIILYFVYVVSLRTPGDLRRILWAAVIGALLAAGAGLWETFSGQSIYVFTGGRSAFGSALPEAVQRQTRARVNGPAADPVYHGVTMVVGSALAIGLALSSRSHWRWPVAAAAVALFLLNVLAAASRAAMLSWVVAVGLMLLGCRLRGRLLVLTGLAAATLLGIVLLSVVAPDLDVEHLFSTQGKAEETAELRLNTALLALRVWLRNPILGCGPDGFVIQYHRYAPRLTPTLRKEPLRPHNTYLQVLVEQGLVGFALYAGFLAAVWLSVFRLARTPPAARRALPLTILAVLSSYLVALGSSSYLTDQLFWSVLAMASAMAGWREWEGRASAR